MENPENTSTQTQIFKKTSANQLLMLYLGKREFDLHEDISANPTRIQGVAYIDPKLTDQKVYCQLTLNFRYGREDEEVMGLKFCNEAVLALHQIWPPKEHDFKLTLLQETLLTKLGENSVPFLIEITKEIPSSVQLLPAKRYSGSPIGTSYDIRIYSIPLNGQPHMDKNKASTVKLGIKLIHKPSIQLSAIPKLCMKISPNSMKSVKQDKISAHTRSFNSYFSDLSFVKNNEEGPSMIIEKPFIWPWTEGRVFLKASLGKSIYSHGETVNIKVEIKNESRKNIKKIKIYLVQFVDVCMFSNGKFKNIVAEIEETKNIGQYQNFQESYDLTPNQGFSKNWTAIEPQFNAHSSPEQNMSLASSTSQKYALNNCETKNIYKDKKRAENYNQKNIFAIHVSYYCKIKIFNSSITGGELCCCKLPFLLYSEKTQETVLSPAIQVKSDENDCKAIAEPSNCEKLASSFSSSSDFNNEEKVGVIEAEAQVHCQKYLESDF